MKKQKCNNCYLSKLGKTVHWLYILTFIAFLSLIILFIDYYNFPSQIIQSLPMGICIISLVAILLGIFSWLWHIGGFSLLKYELVNTADIIIFVLCGSALCCTIYWLISKASCLLKPVTAGVICILTLLYMVIFRRKRTKKRDNLSDSAYQLLDLEKIYQGEFSIQVGKPILIDETDVSYDLLNRSTVINQLLLSICNYQTDHAFAIGLEGPWGSGKSTILNIVKKRLNDEYSDTISVIDDFDPWVLGSQEAIMLSLFDTILEKTGSRYKISHSRKIVRSLKATIASISSATSIIQSISYEKNDYEKVVALKEQLSLYLHRQDKRFVLFIDNIDRASADNILFLLKLIATYFNLPNIIYVIAYDRNRIKQLLEDEKSIDPHYLDKIIQVPISVPQFSQDCLYHLYDRCVANLLTKVGVPSGSLAEYSVLLKTIYNTVPDLRTFKRLLNSAFNAAFSSTNSLPKRELFSIEVIHFLAPELYNKIYSNLEYFVSYGELFDERLAWRSFKMDKFNQDAVEFFNNLKQSYADYFNLLAELFPFVESYNHGRALLTGYSDNSTYKDKSKAMSICSAKYFDLYFSYGMNTHLKIGEDIKRTIIEINKRSADEVCNYLCDIIYETPPQEQKEWFEMFELHLQDIADSRLFSTINALMKSIYAINNSSEFLSLNAHERAMVIIAQIIQRINEKELDAFMTSAFFSGGYLRIIKKILYWLEKTDDKTNSIESRISKIKSAFNELCNKILYNKIDLYEGDYYHRQNIYGLAQYSSENNQKEELFLQYMRSIISEKNVYRILGDALSETLGQTYGYYISTGGLSGICISEEQIDPILKNRKPTTESEIFIQKLYDKFKSRENNDPDNYKITSTVQIKFHL